MKQLFGPHGWLGKSMSMKELPSEKGGFKQFGGKLKQRIENLVGSGTMALRFVPLIGTIDRRCLQVRTHKRLPPPVAFQITFQIQVLGLIEPSITSKTVFGNGANALRYRQSVPHYSATGRPHERREYHESYSILGQQEPAPGHRIHV